MVSRNIRLRKRADFDSARSRGKRVSDQLFALTAAPSGHPETRWGLAVSRRVGNSVVRNRVKRQIRESLRLMPGDAGMDVIVSARPAVAGADSAAIRESLGKLALRVGLLAPSADEAIGSKEDES